MDASLKKERTRTIYNEIAPYYDRFRLLCRRKDIPFVLELLEIGQNDTILDAGMGPGIYTFEILRRYNLENIVGVDISERFVSIAREKAARREYNNVEFKIADLESLPFKDDTFDKIICSGVLLLVPDQQKALSELHRVLKKGGKIVFVEPLNEIFVGKECFYVFAKLFIRLLALKKSSLRGMTRMDFAGHYFSQDALKSLLNTIEFKQVEIIRNRVEIYGICLK